MNITTICNEHKLIQMEFIYVRSLKVPGLIKLGLGWREGHLKANLKKIMF